MSLLHSLLVLSFVATTTAVRPSPTTGSVADSFIRSSCRSTQYPALCEQSLSSYAQSIRGNPRGLALAALNVTLQRAQSACGFVDSLTKSASAAPHRGAIKDCIENLSDGVDRLRRSVVEMNHMGRAGSPDYQLHLSNVQTWISAALTDENTCLDGCRVGTPAGKAVNPAIREALRKHVVELAQVTSNALALVNKIAYGH